MRARVRRRLEHRQRANAELCGVALTEWLALPRARRKQLLTEAKARS